jgi:uncharacterized membrane protein YgaE (UPF0421/DUF939 family)
MLEGDVMARRPLSQAEVKIAILESGLLALACFLTYWLATNLLSRIHSVSPADDMLGGMWAVIATIFVCRVSYHASITAALSRISATTASFVLCLIYLIFLPFHAWALALLIGVSTLTLTLAGRPEDAITAGITTAVIMVVAALSPHDAWEQPILRFADTVVGVAIGIAAAWIGGRVRHQMNSTGGS